MVRILLKIVFNKIALSLLIVFIGYLGYAQNPCPSATSPNMITNGNFESCVIGSLANDGFTSSDTYIGSTTCPGGGGSNTIGEWSVTTSASSLNGAYTNPTGTPGTGNPTPNHYMVIDVNGTANEVVYSTTVNVTSGTTYFFSAWVADINATFTNPPILRFLINGAQVGNLVYVDSLKNTNAWQQFYVTWKAPTSGAIPITIENEQPTSSGNDQALDNISFTSGCATITNLNSLGKTANLIDTLYECDFSFPHTITSGLPTNYGFIWENSSYTALSGTSNQTSYTFTTTPAAGKYYLCYDTIPGCYRADSFIVVNKLSVSLGPNQSICPPINYTVSPTQIPTAPGLTYSWKFNGATITGANSSTYQATQVGAYTLAVTGACGTTTAQMTITSPGSPLAGTVTCASGEYQFSATAGTYNTIDGTPGNVAWYNVPSGGTAFASNPDAVSARVPAISLVTTPGCAIGGLYVQDLNSFYTTLGPTTPPCASYGTTGPASNTAMLITVYANITITSLQIMQQNYSTGSTASYTAEILTNSPGTGPYSSGCGCQLDGPSTTVITGATGPTYTFPQASASSPVLRTLNFGPGGAGYTLTGSPTGTKYWITVTGSEFGFLNCGATYPIENAPYPGIVELTDQLINGNLSSEMQAFNIQFTEGTPNSCNRAWVCESSGCPTPVKFLYINAEVINGAATINWATASEQNNAYFIVQKSSDGVHFTNIDTTTGAGNSNSILTYSYIDRSASDGMTYYRIEQVDLNGDYAYTDILAVTSTNSNLAKIYPVPVKEGGDLTVDLNSSENQLITINIVDIVGKQICQCQRRILKGDNVFAIPTTGLIRGTYLVEVLTQNGDNTVQRIVIN